MRPHCIPLFLVLVCLTFTGCLSWKPSWNEAGPSSSSDIAATLLDEARDLTRDADSAEKLQAAIDAYEHVLEASFADYEALTAVADHSILMATAYTPGRHGKRELFARAMRYSEQAMYRNLEFKALVDQGETPWDASRVLASEELDAMQAWVTAVLYYFKEGMGSVARVANIRWIKRLEPVLTRMEEIDDAWVDGAVAFNWGFYYFILPESMGGNRDTAAEKFALATELAEDRMFVRWGRAKFFSLITKNKEEFRRELEWVAAQNPTQFNDPPHWKAHFQADARTLLNDVDGYFRAGS